MNYEEEKKWLESLKLGDEVCVVGHYGKTICKIEKITPKRQITAMGKIFKEGRCKPAQKWGYGFSIKPVTDEIKKEIISAKITARYRNLTGNKSHIVTEESDMQTIINIIEKYEAKQ